MMTTQFMSRMRPARMGDDADFVDHVLVVMHHPHGLVRNIETSLQIRVVSGYARWTGVAVALQGLNTAQ